MLERLHKILARAGIAALRPAEELILQGRVTVNGRVVRELGARADADTDVIAVDGAAIEIPDPSEPHHYIMLHKPVGVISTAQDTHGRPTVVELVPNNARMFPVGRLDADSEGLILLTDDGDLAYRLTHPRFEVDKEYRVLVDRAPDLPDLRRWRTGVELDGELTAPAWVEVLERADDGTWLRVVMREGRKRQIREVARILGMDVRRLIRVREGPLALADLAPSAWRTLTPSEIEALRAHTQHVPSREADEERERTMSDEEGRRRRLRVVRRPAREASGEEGFTPPSRPASSSDAERADEQRARGSESFSAAASQAPQRRERSRFDQGDAGFAPRADREQRRDRRDDRDGNARGFGGQERFTQGERAPYGGRGGQERRPMGGRQDDRRNAPRSGDNRPGRDFRDRPAYGNDRNRPFGNGERGNRSPYGGNRPSGGGFRDRNAGGGGFRDRHAGGGGFRDRNAGGGFRDRHAGGGGFRDRNAGGGFRDRDTGNFRDRNAGGGFRDRNADGGNFRDRPDARERDRAPYGNRRDDRQERPSFGRDRRGPDRPAFGRDRRGPDGTPRPGGQRASGDGGRRQGGEQRGFGRPLRGQGEERGFGRPSRGPADRGFGRAPRGEGDQRGGFSPRGPRSPEGFGGRPNRDSARGFGRQPSDGGAQRPTSGNRMERQGGFGRNDRPPRSRDDRPWNASSPTRAQRPDRSRRGDDARFERGDRSPRSRDDEE